MTSAPAWLGKPRHRGSSSTVFKKRTPSEKNSLDLDRPWDEQSTGFVPDNYEWRNSIDSTRGPLSVRTREASFSAAAPGQPLFQHLRSTSATLPVSPASVASPSLSVVRGAFVHPLKQTPREPTPPFGDVGLDHSPTIAAGTPSRSSLDLERPSLLQRRSNTLPQLQERRQYEEEEDDDDDDDDDDVENDRKVSPFSQLSHVNSTSTPYTPSFPRRSFASNRSNSYSQQAGDIAIDEVPEMAIPRQPLRIMTSPMPSVTSHPSSLPSSSFASKIKSSTGFRKNRIPLGIVTAGVTASPTLETATASSPSSPAFTASSSHQPIPHALSRSASQLSRHNNSTTLPNTPVATTTTTTTTTTPLSPLRGSSLEVAGLRRSTRSDADETVQQHHVRLARREFEEKERAKAEKKRLKEEKKRERADSKESKARAKAGESSSASRRNSSSTTDVATGNTTATTTGTANSMLQTAPNFSEKFGTDQQQQQQQQQPATPALASGGGGGDAAKATAPDAEKRPLGKRTKAAWIAFILWLRTRLLKLKFKRKKC